MTPEVSIIIPVYNVENYIHQCIKSILSQKDVNFEIIAVDDGSPDNCPAILDNYASKDPRIHVIHQPNGGVSRARNKGLESAAGKWCYFVDSDDWLIKDGLAKALKFADQSDADVVFVDCKECYESGNKKRIRLFSQPFNTADPKTIEDIQASILCHKMSPYFSPGADNAYPAPWRKLVRTGLIRDNNIEFDPYVGGVYDDGLFTLEILEAARRVAYNADCLYNYRILATSIVHTNSKGRIEKFEKNCTRVEDFIKRNGKVQKFTDAEYARRIAYLSSMLATSFSAKGMMDRKEYLSIIGRSPWREAIKGVDPGLLENKHRYTYLCLKSKNTVGLKVYGRLKNFKKKRK